MNKYYMMLIVVASAMVIDNYDFGVGNKGHGTAEKVSENIQ